MAKMILSIAAIVLEDVRESQTYLYFRHTQQRRQRHTNKNEAEFSTGGIIKCTTTDR